MTLEISLSAWRHVRDRLIQNPRARVHEPSNTASTVPTRYMMMLLQQEEIPLWWNLLAAVSSWILLAGYLVFPGTFATLRRSATIQSAARKNRVGAAVYSTVENMPLLVLAVACCVLGATGSGWLWWRWRDNFIWLRRHLFLPILINSLTGLVNTVLNVYTARDGSWSVTAIATASVTGTCAGAAAASYLAYYVFTRRIEAEHEAELKGQRYKASGGDGVWGGAEHE